MNKKGFTLTEILIVLVVAGILLALILPNTLKAIERANVTAQESNLNTVQVALFMCFTEERNWGNCDSFQELIDGNYLEEIPEHPFNGEYTIEADPNGTAGYIACSQGEENFPTDVAPDKCG